MSYAIKEIFLTLQGEGAHAGRAAVFCRISGCNLWSGREQDRATATCRFCDTDFVGTDGTLGGRYGSARELADTIAAQWTAAGANRYVVLTGGDFQKIQHPYLGFENAGAAKEWFSQQQFNNTTVLIKGSRSMQMEKVIETP